MLSGSIDVYRASGPRWSTCYKRALLELTGVGRFRVEARRAIELSFGK